VQAQALADRVVESHAVELTLPAEALVEAVNQATLAAQVSGRVVEVHVDAGQAVRKGDLLMKIDAREASEVAAGASAQYVNARAHYQRMLSLRQQGFVSPAAVDKAKADLDAAQATQGQTTVGVGHATVRAPVSGIVAERFTELGEMAVPGKPLLSIYEPEWPAGHRQHPAVPAGTNALGTAGRVEFPELGRWVDATTVTVFCRPPMRRHMSRRCASVPAGRNRRGCSRHARAGALRDRSRQQADRTAGSRRPAWRGRCGLCAEQQGVLSLRQLRLGEVVAAGEVEVLAGLQAGERVVLDPVKAAIQMKSARQRASSAMGISGRIARFFASSQMTPLLALVALLLGVFATLVTPREEEPQIDVTMADVLIPFPGASVRDVENLVATPAEQVLSRMSGIEHVYSVSRPGLAVVTVQFAVGVKYADAVVRLYDTVHSHRDWLAPNLGVLEPTVKPRGIDDVPIVSLTFWTADPGALRLRPPAGGARRRDRIEAGQGNP
jgi:biotin carboxyl carrier protein